jgi:glutathione-regulated potassium-efflux system ancillary protein KefG
MRKILHILVHPSFEKSRANRVLMEHLPKSDQLTQRDLYELYPTFEIDTAKEKELLLRHDVIMIQHPFYWYSCPPLFKQWIDWVLEHGWAYGEGGIALKGKTWVQVLTTGGDEKAYSEEGFHRHALPDFLLPFRRTAELCHMHYHQPFVLQGTFKRTDAQLEAEGLRFAKFVENMIGGDSHG